MNKQYKLLTCTINGKKVEKMIDVRASLTDVLRDDFRLTSVKKGCEVGECGACNVIIDGECFNSCTISVYGLREKKSLLLKVSPDQMVSYPIFSRHLLMKQLFSVASVHLGFIMSATELLNAWQKNSQMRDRKMMSGHLCRCTGYENIFRAVKKTMLRRLGKNEEADAV